MVAQTQAARLQSELRRPGPDLFVPFGFGIARRMEQIGWSELIEDPGLAAYAIKSAEKGFAADGVINWFDGWLEAESAGLECKRDAAGRVTAVPPPLGAAEDRSGLPAGLLQRQPVKTALDIAGRLCQQAGDHGLVFGYLTGPATLRARLFGGERGDMAANEAAGNVAIALARAYCDAGVSALVVSEEEADVDEAAVAVLAAMFNLADYYGTPVIHLSRVSLRAGAAGALAKLGGRIPGSDPDIIALPIGTASVDQCADAWRAARTANRRLVISNGDIPAETPAEDLIVLANIIKSA
ncbi:MAG: hypothetical protein EXR27_11060 [Betaproteobacteria bacterium]|nr:hypothetical protein [Betaproteobacteria bacterium]